MNISQYKLALLEIVKSKKDIYRVKCLNRKNTDFLLYRYYAGSNPVYGTFICNKFDN